ncbi:hypothetical protein SEVIR_4G241650v4 [Setaria viridis]
MATSSCTRRQSGSVFPGELKSYGESGIQLGILLENGLQREGAFCLGKGCFFPIGCNLQHRQQIVSAARIAIFYLQQSNFVNISFLLQCSIASPCGVPFSISLSQQIDSRMYPEWVDVGTYPPIESATEGFCCRQAELIQQYCRWGEKSVWHQQQEAEDPVSYAVTADRAIHFTRS